MAFSSSFLSSLLSHLHPRQCCRRHSHARIFASDNPSPSQEFDASLGEKLEKLLPIVESANSPNLLNLTWLCTALDVVISTQASTLHFVNKHSAGPDITTMPSDQMIQQYMEDSVKMLDACCLLKESLASVHAFVKASHRTLKRLKGLKLVREGEIRRAKHDLLSTQHAQERMQKQEGKTGVRKCGNGHRLQACTSMLRKMRDKLACLPPPPPHHQYHHHLDGRALSSGSEAVSAALYGGEICTTFFLGILSTALSPCRTARKTSSCSMVTPPQVERTWGTYLLALQVQLHAEILYIKQKRKRECNEPLLPELQALDASLHRIWEALQKPAASPLIWQQAQEDVCVLLRSTSALADHVQSSVARLHCQLDCISSSIVIHEWPCYTGIKSL